MKEIIMNICFYFIISPAHSILSQSSNTPAHPHGAANSHNPPEHYRPVNPVRWLRIYSGQPRFRLWCNRWRSAAVRIFDLHTGSVDIEFTRNNLIHVVLPKIKIIRTRRCGSDYSSLVHRKGLEPPTLGTGIRCSIH